MKIVQLGACWGNDHVTELVKSTDNVEFLLLVEPNPKVQEKLKECYNFLPHTKIEQVAIVANYKNGNEMDMFFAERDSIGGYQVTSLIRNHVEKHHYSSEEIETFRTKCTTLPELLDKYGVIELDYLFLDIEGVDTDVLFNLDLKKYNIKNICIEFIHLTDPENVYQYLRDNGYTDTNTVVNLYDKMFVKEN